MKQLALMESTEKPSERHRSRNYKFGKPAPNKRVSAAAGIGAAIAAWSKKKGLALDSQNQVSAEPDTPCPVSLDGPSAEHKLAQKATFGYYSGVEQEIATTGYATWLNQQIAYQTDPNWIQYEQDLAMEYPTITALPGDPDVCNGLGVSQLRQELVKARVKRAVESPAQLFERMVEFWTDHLNTWHLTSNLDKMKTFEDNWAIRPFSLGKLSELLKASATSPAMLIYLNGDQNTAGNPNENFAREFLELHTLGADVCYTESTIQEFAKVLTGWQVLKGSGNCGEVPCLDPMNPSCNPNKHEPGDKVLDFGSCGVFTITGGSANSELDQVIHILTNPNTPYMGRQTIGFIARKLAGYFVSCDPPERLITEMFNAYKDAYNSGRDDIAAMVKVMLSKRWIYCSKPILKRPLHLLASTLRATATLIDDPGTETQANTLVGGFLSAAGHRPYNWPAPNGYHSPCDQTYWGGNQLARWNLASKIFTFPVQVIGINYNASIQGATNNTPQQLIDLIDQVGYGGFMPTDQKNAVLQYMQIPNYSCANPPPYNLRLLEGIGLAVAAPAFQWF